MAKSEDTFFCVANKRIIKEGRLNVNSGYESIAILEVHNKNQYATEDEAVEVARALAQRYTSDFYVLKAVKCVRRERPPVDVVELK